jgi:hypothetical protein
MEYLHERSRYKPLPDQYNRGAISCRRSTSLAKPALHAI